ncbi:MAG: glycosyltransferase family 2 protein [Candidatus Daviesbacteria bacterium]|nr:glycosyltransferase family 2 protein [Candidatus Daviesbacteria bacterium]
MDKKRPLISVIIPTYQEAGNIEEMVRRTRESTKSYSTEIIIVDGGSKDHTPDIAEKAGASKIMRLPFKRGKGIDFWDAVKIAKGDYIIEIDADLQFDPEQIPLFVKAFQDGAQVVIAERENYKQSPLWRTIGNKSLSFLTTLILMYPIHDVLAGFKAARREVMLSLDLKETGFMYESEIVVKAVRMGYELKQIPVKYRRRMRESSQVSLVKDGLRFVRSIIYFGLIVPPPRNLLIKR